MIQEFISIKQDFDKWNKEVNNYLFYADFCNESEKTERRKLELFDKGTDSFEAGETIVKEFGISTF